MKINQDQLAYETAYSIYRTSSNSTVRRIMKDVMAKLRERGVTECR